MFNSVDLIGADAVCKMLEQTGLKRFIIYRQGAGKGSTPVYDCSHTITNGMAVKCFKDWAVNITQFNPNNFLCYELLAFNDFEDGGGDAQNINAHEQNGQQGKKRGKMRISFALNAAVQNFGYNAPMQNLTPQIDVQNEIQKGIELAMMRKELEELRAFKKEIEEEEDEDEDESGDIVDKVAGILNTFKEHKAMEDAAHINGDNINENLTEVKNRHNLTPAELSIKTQNINKAIKTLWKHNKNLDTDLLKLANLAENDTILFKMILTKLRSF